MRVFGCPPFKTGDWVCKCLSHEQVLWMTTVPINPIYCLKMIVLQKLKKNLQCNTITRELACTEFRSNIKPPGDFGIPVWTLSPVTLPWPGILWNKNYKRMPVLKYTRYFLESLFLRVHYQYKGIIQQFKFSICLKLKWSDHVMTVNLK